MKENQRRAYTGQFYRKNRWAFCLASLAALLTNGLNLGITWVLQQMIDRVSGVPGTLSLQMLALLTAAIVVLIVIFKGLRYVSLPRFMERAMGQYKEYVFQKLTEKSIASFSRENTAVYLSALSNDAAVIEGSYLEKLFQMMGSLLLLLGSLGMMLAYSPMMTVVACGFLILPVGASLLAGSRMEQAERRVSDQNQRLTATLKDCLSGFSVIKSFRAEGAVRELFTKRNRAVEAAKLEKRKTAVVISTMAAVAGVTAQLGTFLAGAWLVMEGWGITPGILLVFVDLTGNVIHPIQELPELLASRRAALALVDKLARALEDNRQAEGGQALGRVTEEIRLRQVSFGYEETKPVLQGVDLTFAAGKCYALVGASGSGKSTLLDLLMAGHGSYAGQICYDGKELRTVSPADLYDQVAMIQQSVFLFNATIRENVTMFQPFPHQAVEQAMALAGLEPVMQARGADYLCGENGSGLSGGEKQRIAIARSLLRKSSVLLADEATSALDVQTGRQVAEALLGLEGITRILVTHSLEPALLRRCDGIVALKNGSVAEQGTFDELMERKGYFYSLYTLAR